jgi:hypothetical protein
MEWISLDRRISQLPKAKVESLGNQINSCNCGQFFLSLEILIHVFSVIQIFEGRNSHAWGRSVLHEAQFPHWQKTIIIPASQVSYKELKECIERPSTEHCTKCHGISANSDCDYFKKELCKLGWEEKCSLGLVSFPRGHDTERKTERWGKVHPHLQCPPFFGDLPSTVDMLFCFYSEFI